MGQNITRRAKIKGVIKDNPKTLKESKFHYPITTLKLSTTNIILLLEIIYFIYLTKKILVFDREKSDF